MIKSVHHVGEHMYTLYRYYICDTICENMSNCGFNKYFLAAFLPAYITVSISCFLSTL